MTQVCGVDHAKGNWYKGNLHCHSTESDGSLAPETIVRMYREKGYSFLAFTEHETFSNHDDFDTADFRILPGIERSVRIGGTHRLYHFNGIWDPGNSDDGVGTPDGAASLSDVRPQPHGLRLPEAEREGCETAQAEVHSLARKGYLVTLNHPVWSRNDFRDVDAVDGYFAVEVYNHGCEVETRTGTAAPFWDYLLSSGRRVLGIASDDNHNRNVFGEVPPDWDSFGGWVMVNAAELTPAAISSALRAGRFYSSSGPEVHAFGVTRDEVYVECSPVEAVYFTRFPGHGYSRRARGGSLITRASLPLCGKETYVRAECVDARGRTAWTNPVFLPTHC